MQAMPAAQEVVKSASTVDQKVKEEPQNFKPKRESKQEREKRTAKSGSSIMEKQNKLRAEAAKKKKEEAAKKRAEQSAQGGPPQKG